MLLLVRNFRTVKCFKTSGYLRVRVPVPQSSYSGAFESPIKLKRKLLLWAPFAPHIHLVSLRILPNYDEINDLAA